MEMMYCSCVITLCFTAEAIFPEHRVLNVHTGSTINEAERGTSEVVSRADVFFLWGREKKEKTSARERLHLRLLSAGMHSTTRYSKLNMIIAIHLAFPM